MYTTQILETGLNYLGITDPEIIVGILESNEINKEDIRQKKLSILRYEAYKNRGEVPKGLSKKELVALQKETQKIIDGYLERKRDRDITDASKDFIDILLEDVWVPKKEKIKARLEFFSAKKEEIDVTHAKSYPIEELLHFNPGGFVSCPFHGPERTPSMKWYPKRNKAHCFAGCGDFDSIDIYQKIHNVDFINAIKALSPNNGTTCPTYQKNKR